MNIQHPTSRYGENFYRKVETHHGDHEPAVVERRYGNWRPLTINYRSSPVIRTRGVLLHDLWMLPEVTQQGFSYAPVFAILPASTHDRSIKQMLSFPRVSNRYPVGRLPQPIRITPMGGVGYEEVKHQRRFVISLIT